jgi:ABC-type amino acid transport substrate-binding protein
VRARRRLSFRALLALALLVAGCNLPRDPEDSLNRIRRTGVLRAGFTVHEPWVRLEGDTAAGPEADVVKAFAASLGARVEWRHGSESQLFEALEKFEVDVAIGGFEQTNPWAPKLGTTRPYVEVGSKKHIVALPPGENRLLVEFERALRARAPAVAAFVGGTPVS